MSNVIYTPTGELKWSDTVFELLVPPAVYPVASIPKSAQVCDGGVPRNHAVKEKLIIPKDRANL
jgi:hypothetical protein